MRLGERLLLAIALMYPGLYYFLSFFPFVGGLSLAGALNIATVVLTLAFISISLLADSRISVLALSALGYVAALLYSVAVSPDIGYSLRPFMTMAVQALMYVALSVNPVPLFKASNVVRIALLSMLLPVGIALIQLVYFLPGVEAFIYQLPRGISGNWGPNYPGLGNRLIGTFAVHTFFAQGVALLLIGLIFSGSKAFGRLGTVYLIFAAVCLLFSWTRTAWIAVAVSLLPLTFISRSIQRLVIALVVTVTLSLAIVEAVSGGPLSTLAAERLSSSVQSINDRFELVNSVDGISVIGIGLGRGVYATVSAGAFSVDGSDDQTGQTIHNVPLSAFTEGGVVLLGAYVLLLGSIARFALILFRNPELQRMGLLVLAQLVILFITGLTEDSFAAPGVIGFWIMVTGIERLRRETYGFQAAAPIMESASGNTLLSRP